MEAGGRSDGRGHFVDGSRHRRIRTWRFRGRAAHDLDRRARSRDAGLRRGRRPVPGDGGVASEGGRRRRSSAAAARRSQGRQAAAAAVRARLLVEDVERRRARRAAAEPRAAAPRRDGGVGGGRAEGSDGARRRGSRGARERAGRHGPRGRGRGRDREKEGGAAETPREVVPAVGHRRADARRAHVAARARGLVFVGAVFVPRSVERPTPARCTDGSKRGLFAGPSPVKNHRARSGPTSGRRRYRGSTKGGSRAFAPARRRARQQRRKREAASARIRPARSPS